MYKESYDRKPVEMAPLQWLLKTPLKNVAGFSAGSNSWVRRLPSISRSMRFVSFLLKEDTYFQKFARMS